MDKKDLSIISHLRQDARMKLAKMSKLTGIPISTIFDRIKANEGKTIEKCTVVLDYNLLGYSARINVILKLGKNDKEKITEFLERHPNVNNLYKINNGYDLMIDGIFKHVKDAEEFIENLEENFVIKSKEIFYIIDSLKKEGFLNSQEQVEYLINS